MAFAVAVIGDGVAEAETKWREDAANKAAVDAKRKLLFRPVAFWPLLLMAVAVAVVFVVEFKFKTNAAAAGCWRRTPVAAAVVDNARHDVGEEGEEEDGGCRSGPRTFVAEVDVEVEVIVLLLLIARHDDDNRAERVAVHAAQDAIFSWM